ncbi:C40 family peptidase [Rhodobacter maris]|uniref:NlpC/P60 family protein n=1 Tax=Rhodobacter maris TaxID=446682 RepID=A0A285SHV9_9RHOB|nr:NlpC/P60 family protein [Rhodobacter maris]SOC05368.1 NlpC/P60 family protein [Rhodobacter maris]
MSDARLTPFSGKIARESLRGQVAAEVFVPGEAARVITPVADLALDPAGGRDRQLILGAEVVVIERRAARAFVQADLDGYCGWVDAETLGAPQTATHVVASRGTHLYRAASIKRGEICALSMGSRLAVLGFEGELARTPEGFVPATHLRALDDPEPDPVSVAERLVGTPYLWGANGAFGIDCSGLVQLAFTLCGRACPGDSDLQRAAFGDFLPEGSPFARGDLLFWQGHIAMALSGEAMIHATGHTMRVLIEPIAPALARIEATGTAPYFGAKRPD